MIEMGVEAVRKMGSHWVVKKCFPNEHSKFSQYSPYRVYRQVPLFFNKMNHKPYSFMSVDEYPYSTFMMYFNFQADSIEQTLLLNINDIIEYFESHIERYQKRLLQAQFKFDRKNNLLFKWGEDFKTCQKSLEACKHDLSVLEEGRERAFQIKSSIQSRMPDDTDDEELWIQQFVDKAFFESDIRDFVHDYMVVHELPEKIRINAEDFHQTPVFYIDLNKLNTLFHQHLEEPLIQSGHIVISGIYDADYDWMIDGKTRVMTINSISHALRCSKTESIICSLYTNHDRPFRTMPNLHGLLLFKTEEEANAYLHERLEYALKNIHRAQGASKEHQ